MKAEYKLSHLKNRYIFYIFDIFVRDRLFGLGNISSLEHGAEAKAMGLLRALGYSLRSIAITTIVCFNPSCNLDAVYISLHIGFVTKHTIVLIHFYTYFLVIV